jgi:hypothetical protein
MFQRKGRMRSEAELGTCCACGEAPSDGIVLLPGKAPKPGTGWGCSTCKLPSDGAMAVICQACLQANRVPVYALGDSLGTPTRVLVRELLGEHHHYPGCPKRPGGRVSPEEAA